MDIIFQFCLFERHGDFSALAQYVNRGGAVFPLKFRYQDDRMRVEARSPNATPSRIPVGDTVVAVIVILDLRSNGGGNSTMGWGVLRTMIDRNYGELTPNPDCPWPVALSGVCPLAVFERKNKWPWARQPTAYGYCIHIPHH